MGTYEYTGVVEEVLPVQTFNKGFRKRVLVVGEDVGFEGKYPAHNPFEFKGEHVNDLEGIRKGMRVKVTFGLDGRKWDGDAGTKYFPQLSAFKIVLLAGEGERTVAPEPATPPSAVSGQGSYDDEDLPF